MPSRTPSSVCVWALALANGCLGTEARPAHLVPPGQSHAPTAELPGATSSPSANLAPPGGTARSESLPHPIAPGSAETLAPVHPSELQVTSGQISAGAARRFRVRSPSFRAEWGVVPRAVAEIDFTYRGPTEADAPLASGELRRQIGLKLRAQNSCNVVYVMWHIEPSQGIVVSVKSNPGQRRHADCGAGGYSFLEPSRAEPVSAIVVGQPHVLKAAIRGGELQVVTDGVTSWQGRLPEAVFTFDGPVGVRSDNGDFDVELRAPAAPTL
jgi:hypothetical protein